MKNLLEALDIDLSSISDDRIRHAFELLFNIVEDLSAENRRLLEENRRLRDEINRLKGEQGRPNIKGDKRPSEISRGGGDTSSESERKKSNKKSGKKKSKKGRLRIHKREICHVNKDELPDDAEFKGYQSVVIQDVKVISENIEFKKEVYYSPSQKKTYMAALPLGYEGEFGPNLKALVIVMYFVANMTQPKILAFLENYHVRISSATLSNILIKDKEMFHHEKTALYEAGLQWSSYQQTDDTSARVNGENHYTHVVCNALYTAYFTTKRKDRLTVLDVLRNFRARHYVFDEQTYSFLEKFNLSAKLIGRLKQQLPYDQVLNQSEMESLLDNQALKLGKIQKTRILESAAISAYQKEVDHPVVKLLVSDDAPQFKLLSEELALCWIHDGRHYKKLSPVIAYHINCLEAFLIQYWEYYQKLCAYKQTPSQTAADRLSQEFDELFSTVSGYNALDERIAKTRQKKTELLMVLKYPEIPLHNNQSELAARIKVRKRDISLQTKTKEGTQASDTFLSIAETSRKLGVNIYEFIFDRISQKFQLPSLADIIRRKALNSEISPIKSEAKTIYSATI